MSNIEYYAKLKISNGQLSHFKAQADAIVHIAKDSKSVLRCDWFINEEKGEAVAMVVHTDNAAMQLHHAAAHAHYEAIAACCKGTLQFFGAAPSPIPAALTQLNPRTLPFAYGLQATPTTITQSYLAGGGIEIYTLIDIFAEHLDGCKAVGADLIPIVSSKDPGTTRYDWFYDDEKLQCVAMDCYKDTPSMFAHMKNAHDVHELLFDHSTMVTEFLGELPEEAKAAVARYNPYILPLYAGLKG